MDTQLRVPCPSSRTTWAWGWMVSEVSKGPAGTSRLKLRFIAHIFKFKKGWGTLDRTNVAFHIFRSIISHLQMCCILPLHAYAYLTALDVVVVRTDCKVNLHVRCEKMRGGFFGHRIRPIRECLRNGLERFRSSIGWARFENFANFVKLWSKI